MKVSIDNKLLRKLIALDAKSGQQVLLEIGTKAGMPTDGLQISFGWPSLLEYLGLGVVFGKITKFHKEHQLFETITTTSILESERDIAIRLYDEIFVDALVAVKALSEIQPAFLLEQIQKKSSLPCELFSQTLTFYENYLRESPSHALHDLTLYLAWDVVCINLAMVFDHIYSTQNVQSGLKILRECLIESFEHITTQKRTSPSFFRLIEALYAYQMRDEHLQGYTESDWLTLCQSSKALRLREELMNVAYIDGAISHEMRVLTLDTPDVVRTSISLAQLEIGKLRAENSSWHYTLHPIEVICLKEHESTFVVDTIVKDIGE